MTNSTAPQVLMVLDVDGTISRIYRDEEYDAHRDDPDWYQPLPLDEEVIDALDELARRPGVDVAWLTTWGPSQGAIDRLLGNGHLRHRLAGNAVPWIGFARRDWRGRSFLSYVEQIGPRAVIWADDDAPRGIDRRIDERLGIPRLVIRPHVHVGLTMDHVDRIRAFIDERTWCRSG